MLRSRALATGQSKPAPALPERRNVTLGLMAVLLGTTVGCGGGQPQPTQQPTQTTPSHVDEQAQRPSNPAGETSDIAAANSAAATDGSQDGPAVGGAQTATGETTGSGDTTAAAATTDSADSSEPAEPAVDPALAWRQRVGRGRSVFRQTCDTCHPDGEADLGPGIRGLGFSVERMTRQIRRGSGRMRPIGPNKLPDRYLGDLMAYLSVLRAVRGVER